MPHQFVIWQPRACVVRWVAIHGRVDRPAAWVRSVGGAVDPAHTHSRWACFAAPQEQPSADSGFACACGAIVVATLFLCSYRPDRRFNAPSHVVHCPLLGASQHMAAHSGRVAIAPAAVLLQPPRSYSAHRQPLVAMRARGLSSASSAFAGPLSPQLQSQHSRPHPAGQWTTPLALCAKVGGAVGGQAAWAGRFAVVTETPSPHTS